MGGTYSFLARFLMIVVLIIVMTVIVQQFMIPEIGKDTGNKNINVVNGAKLFQGTVSFKNKAVSCVGCHNVNSSLVISGGTLAKDLTNTYSMYGGDEAGAAETLKAMISTSANMPSSIMIEAYKGKELTQNEISDVVAFLKEASSESVPDKDSKTTFIILAIAGAIILFLLLSIAGLKRKKKSVNQDLYDRQQKSSWRELN